MGGGSERRGGCERRGLRGGRAEGQRKLPNIMKSMIMKITPFK